MASVAAIATTVSMLSPAYADTFNINVDNGESVMLLLTITDMNLGSPEKIFNGNISSGQMLSVRINGDNGGNNGHITWKASNAERTKCGEGDVSKLSVGANVAVKAQSPC
jgi:hypothetical protein